MAGQSFDLPPDLAAPVGHRDRIQEFARGLIGKHLEADASGELRDIGEPLEAERSRLPR